jgi:hypothetical protein
MPVKIWEIKDGLLTSHVVTDWERVWTAEEFRVEADDLDGKLDAILDAAVARVEKEHSTNVSLEFVRAWAIGACLNESDVLQSAAMRREQPQLLGLALARKIRVGARADGSRTDNWSDLRPHRIEEPRREGHKLDHFAMCRWLAEQSLEESIDTFGGSVRNAWQMLERPTLARAPVLRSALLRWLRSLPIEARNHCYERNVFAEMMKTLRRRWPERGPGAAKKPIHYSEPQLEDELKRLLAPFAQPTA